ncbi:coatomer subunit beta' [Lachancea thermotolerans CBS 6340]|uniref:Coatomer subunit beta' n=1 Tax=Lachancea thermotolerans (strain ATCC 56472 / CBS 6340 / NRRL Y-8284) TaxID=559295 RepID=C5E2B5_LACTC|nr:KLTH0H03608p [Lachancea thermotolerans CBS 6340]CAR30176.1 KLTH0H03608p [Lachancea thermotolerans CBS 6340]
MKLDIKKAFSNRSDRVKGIDFHPTEPWVLTTLYSGRVEIWNFETQTEVKSITVTETPVRAGKFIARKNWIVVGSDDFKIRVFNYNTGEKIADFEAHPDYIRSIAVHPTRPYVLSASDDLTMKFWNWEKNWSLEQTFEGHEHFVMGVAFNPKDPSTFASACLDHTVKIWSLGQPTANFTLHAHETRGVNYVDYYPLQDKPYLITSSDDRTVKIWDYQTKSCVATLEGHMANVSFAVFHPALPIIISGSEDGTLKVWNSNTYKLEKTLNLGLERSWCIATHPTGKRNYVASGFDNGFTVLSFGNDDPKLSLDPVGKLVWCGGKNASATDVFTAAIRGTEGADDGEPLPLQTKELGNVDVFPQSLKHSPNGRFVTVVGDGEYIVYTALAWRNKAFGKCHDFVWGPDSNSYALIDESGHVKFHKNFKELTSWSIPLEFGVEKLYAGALLGVKADGFVYFFDWDSGSLVRRIDVDANDVVWSENGELLMIINNVDENNTEERAAYVLGFNREAYESFLASEEEPSEDGIDEAFDVLYEVSDPIGSGKWVGDVFIFTTKTNRLNYFVGGKSYNLAHFDKEMYMLGYLPRDNKVYLADRDIHIYSYEISIEVLEFQTLVLRGELEQAKTSVLPNIEGKENLLKISRFLEGQEYHEDALEISPDNDQKFDLALKLSKLSLAHDIVAGDDNEFKWRKLGDKALEGFDFQLAIEAYDNAADLESLFLLYSSFKDQAGLVDVGDRAQRLGKYNLAFNAYWSAGDVDRARDLLVSSGRYSEAAVLSKAYGGKLEDTNAIVAQWKESLIEVGKAGVASRIHELSKADQVSAEEPLIDIETEAGQGEKQPVGEPLEEAATDETPTDGTPTDETPPETHAEDEAAQNLQE